MCDYTKFEILLTRKQINSKVAEIAEQLKIKLQKYNEHNVILVGLLKGVVFFFVDLVRALDNPYYNIELIKVSSYVDDKSTGEVRIKSRLGELDGKVIVLIDDIIDTGRTFQVLTKYILERNPQELISVAFLDKPERRIVDFHPDFSGYKIPDEFVVGYGLDYNDKFRCLSDIRIYSNNQS